MQFPIASNKWPLVQQDKDKIQTVLANPGYLLLKEIIAAHCVVAQVDAMNASLYDKDNPNAQAVASGAQAKAARLNAALDVLDEIEAKPDEWFKVTLEPRR